MSHQKFFLFALKRLTLIIYQLAREDESQKMIIMNFKAIREMENYNFLA